MMQAEIDDRLPGTVLRFSRKRPFRVGVLYKRQAMALMMLPIKDPLELLDAVELLARALSADAHNSLIYHDYVRASEAITGYRRPG
ncbi:hypothetical protein [Caballeronia sp.]|uniref:hypothetical protein n=1 Tax=Caballeronia sp. TaxID=1931223 RepID=UPI003C46D579